MLELTFYFILYTLYCLFALVFIAFLPEIVNNIINELKDIHQNKDKYN